MTKIGLLSDTHGFLFPRIGELLSHCDEIWHAGDIGNSLVISQLSAIAPVRAVYGNIDGQDICRSHPEIQLFTCEKLKVLMIHIGGYPGRYESKVRRLIRDEKPGLLITGHSHILKVIYDDVNSLLHINPGAAGKYGFHKVPTLVRFTINESEIKDLEVVELSKNNR